MLSLISTLGGLLVSGLPSLLGFFQDKSDKAHEMELARLQNERELAMAERGFLAQQKIEEIRTEQVAMQSEAQMQNAALDHDKKVMEKASRWAVNYVATVRPTVTYIFVLELVLINISLTYWMFTHNTMINSVADLVAISNIIFSEAESNRSLSQRESIRLHPLSKFPIWR